MSGAGTLVVTTALRSGRDERERAEALAAGLGCSCVPREGRSLEDLGRLTGADGMVVVSRERVSLIAGGQELFFHPGLAKLRIKELAAGKTDQMVKAMGLRPRDRVLDCTVGLAADALVAGYAVGDGGRVLGLEAVTAVALIVGHGLEQYRSGDDPLAEAVRRVDILAADYRQYLPAAPSGSFDVVYFDPMFRSPRPKSSAMAPLRLLAERAPVDAAAVTEALRVARRRVVMKERRDSPEFERLGFRRVVGGRHSPVAYGVLDKGEE